MSAQGDFIAAMAPTHNQEYLYSREETIAGLTVRNV